MALDKRNQPDDIDRRSPPEFSPEASDSRSAGSRSKASIRASLACVQCRSKHVKCDATQPSCGRCVAEGKPCYYAKSRRGIRDPKKRSLISDQPPISSWQDMSMGAAAKPAPVVLPFEASDSLPNGWMAQRQTGACESFVDAFFNHFYPGHPILPPKRYFLKYAESDPNSYHFLLSVIDFCGALYVKSARLNDLREAAYAAACGPLPFTVQSVQGLHLLAVIAFGESKFPHHIGFGDRCLAMAMELGMHQKSFADRALDAVWAESCRRTWWYIKFQSMIRCHSEVDPATEVYDIASDADIPCSEEWEYQSGDIPPPMSLSQYEREVNLGRSDFGSLAYQIEMCRIQADITTLCDGSEVEDMDTNLINQADSKICDFLRRVPRWKMDVVDPDGKPDQVLFGAVAWAHISRIRLRQSTLRKGLNLREYFPLGPNRGPEPKGQAVKRFGWNLHSLDIQAANSICDLFRYPYPVKGLRPMMIPGLLRVAIVYLDACVFLGLDSPIFRERINALIRILTIHGETWPLSKRIADDIQAVADEYLAPKLQPSTHPNVWNPIAADVMGSGPFFEASTLGFDNYSIPDPQLSCLLLGYGADRTMSPMLSAWRGD